MDGHKFIIYINGIYCDCGNIVFTSSFLFTFPITLRGISGTSLAYYLSRREHECHHLT